MVQSVRCLIRITLDEFGKVSFSVKISLLDPLRARLACVRCGQQKLLLTLSQVHLMLHIVHRLVEVVHCCAFKAWVDVVHIEQTCRRMCKVVS